MSFTVFDWKTNALFFKAVFKEKTIVLRIKTNLSLTFPFYRAIIKKLHQNDNNFR